MVPEIDTITDTGIGATTDLMFKATDNGVEITVVVVATVAEIVQAMVTAAKATVAENAETVAGNAVNAEKWKQTRKQWRRAQ